MVNTSYKASQQNILHFELLLILPLNILQILGRGGRRFEYAGFKQMYTQFTLAFPRTFSHRNSNLTIQPTRQARDSGYITITNESKGYIIAPMDHLSMSYRFLGHIHGFATPTL